MRLGKLAFCAAIGCHGITLAGDTQHAYFNSKVFGTQPVALVAWCDCDEAVCGCECPAAAPTCGSESSGCEPAESEPATCDSSSCAADCDAQIESNCCDASGCDSSGCDA